MSNEKVEIKEYKGFYGKYKLMIDLVKILFSKEYILIWRHRKHYEFVFDGTPESIEAQKAIVSQLKIPNK